MNNFSFYNPVKILFGKDQIQNLPKEIKSSSKVLILYGGGSIKKNGLYQQVKKALDNFTLFEFSGIEPNPRYETLMKAVQLIKEKGIDFLLAVGGGSVLDGTKFIAAASCYQGKDPWEILTGEGKIQSALPLASIMTLPATGSEMNSFSVITRNETDKLAFAHPKVFPQFSIIDPVTTFSLPPRQIGNGIVDAFTHVMEQYLTYPTNSPLQDRFAESILTTLIEEGPKTVKNPEDYDARANLCLSAAFALNGILSMGTVGDWSTHMIGHELTAIYGLDHAQTLAIILPSMMNYRKEQKKLKLLQYASRVFNLKYQKGDESLAIDQAINQTRHFFESVGVKTKLSGYGIDKNSFDKVIANLRKHSMTKLSEHGDLTPEDVLNILNLSY